MPSDRRGFLRSFLAGATVAAAAPAAFAALPAQVVEPSAAPAPKQEAEGLIEIGRRVPDLLEEFWDASADLKDTRAGFDETAPLPPKSQKRAKDQAKRMFKQPLIKIVPDAPPSTASPLTSAPLMRPRVYPPCVMPH